MYPEIFSLGSLEIRSYGVMLALAFLGGTLVARQEAKRVGLDTMYVTDLLLWGMLSSIVGSRVVFVLTHFEYLKDPSVWQTFINVINFTRGGLVFYGGFIGGTLAAILYFRYRRLPVAPMIDLVGIAVPVGIGLGRLGCFLNGCCWGKVCGLPWAVQFPRIPAEIGENPTDYVFQDHLSRGWVSAADSHSQPVHPTQLYETVAMLVFFAFLWSIRKRKRFDGQTGLTVIAGYAVWRFTNELLRGDNPRAYWGLTVSQVISVGLFLLSGGLLAYLIHKRAYEKPVFDFSTVPPLYPDEPASTDQRSKKNRNSGGHGRKKGRTKKKKTTARKE